MSAGIDENDRHIFPRWRSFRATSDLGELTSPAIGHDNDTTDLDVSLAKGIASWEGDPSLWRGLDLLGSAIVAGRLDNFSALIASIKSNPLAPRISRDLLERTRTPQAVQLDLPDYEQIPNLVAQREIGKRRSQLALVPRDPIEWVELARFYTIAGVNNKAKKAILAALQLAPHNRFVLRSAARFFIHVGDKDEAHNLLSKASTIKEDPWLLASEIAIADSMGKTSRFSRIARKKIDADVPPSELTELASALGSLEADSGNHRIARRFLRQALVKANENSIAQIQWLNRARLGEAIDVSEANPPLLHEANAWSYYYKGDFTAARDESLCWLRDQPFASAPASLSSYILAELLADYPTGKAITSAALRSNPADSTLLNNLAVCLIELGELPEAEEILSRLEMEVNDKKVNAVYKATFGKLAFRKGDIERGRLLYLEAIQEAKDSNIKATAARAAIHLATEEVIADTPLIGEAIQRLKEYKEYESTNEIASLLDRMNELLQRS
jgi:tetratricopeptide (TPR) repeat protein